MRTGERQTLVALIEGPGVDEAFEFRLVGYEAAGVVVCEDSIVSCSYSTATVTLKYPSHERSRRVA